VNTQTPSLPQERPGSRWLWLVLSPLIFVVGVCAVLVTMAIKYGDDVVYDDYYKEGKMINHRFAAEHYAQQEGILGSLSFNKQNGQLSLTLSEPRSSSEQLILKFSHPVESDRDISYPLSRISLKNYSTAYQTFPEGRWYVRVEAFEQGQKKLLWRVSGEVNFSESATAELY